MEDTDFHELGRQLLTEFGSMHHRISRSADKALGGEMAVMRALIMVLEYTASKLTLLRYSERSPADFFPSSERG